MFFGIMQEGAKNRRHMLDMKFGRRFVVECAQVNKEGNVAGRSEPGLGD
jgi:hypothetical protein